jgi:RHS repeat-associated protein
VVITQTKGNVIQYNEYYPFQHTTANSWTRDNTTGNNFLGNGGTEVNTTTQLYDLDYRHFDPLLGRMNGVDPVATKYASLTPYNYSFNDPVTFTDVNGADPNAGCMACAYGYMDPESRGRAIGMAPITFMDPGGGGGSWTWNPYTAGGYGMTVGGYLGSFALPAPGRSQDDGSITRSDNTWTINWGQIGNYGATWNRGSGSRQFTSHEEALYITGRALSSSGGWDETVYQSFAASFVALGIATQSGTMPSYTAVQYVLHPKMANLIASKSAMAMGDSWAQIMWKAYVTHLRTTPMLGTAPNPFLYSEAIFFDYGWSFVGAEGDEGWFLTMVGSDLGKISSFSELAAGGSWDASLGIEVGRVDYTGNPNDFKADFFYGERFKGWGSVALPYGFSVGGGFAMSSQLDDGHYAIAYAIQGAWGFNPIPGWLTLGFNRGDIKPRK